MQDDPTRLPPLDLLATFAAAARQRSFTKAAAERFVTQSAVSRQVAALEDHLGVALFQRRHRALDLTPQGEQLAGAVQQALTLLRATVAQIRAPQRREVLSLTTTPGLASLWLIPRLAGFLDSHPGIDVRIDATHKRRALAGEGFDIAIRYAGLGQSEGGALFAETIQPVCAPALLRDPARPLLQPADLKRHTLLQVAMPMGAGVPLEWQSWLQAFGVGDLEPAAVLSFNNFDAATAAALAGQGVLLGRRPLLDNLITRGELVTPFRGGVETARGYYVVVEPASAAKPAVQALRDWLLAQAAAGPPGAARRRAARVT